MTSTRLSLAVLYAGCSLFVVAPSAHADEPAAADIAAARAFGQEGMKLADAGNCLEAIDRLARAEKLYHAPTTQARLGECQIATGQIVEGTENLNRVIRQVLAATAPAPFFAAQERAKTLYAEAKPKIARLTIAVVAPPGVEPVVTIDGERVPVANLNTNRPTNPGAHRIEARAPGFKLATANVLLAEGGSDSTTLTLVAEANALPTEPIRATPALSPPSWREPKRSVAAPVLAFGVGAAGLAVGAVFGAMALGKKGELDAACGSVKTQCPSFSSDDLGMGKTFGTVSTIGFIVGGVGVAAGVVMLITGRPRSTVSSAHGGVPPRSAIEPRIGLGSFALGGSF